MNFTKTIPFLLLLPAVWMCQLTASCQPVISLSKITLGESISNQTLIFEDAEGALKAEEVAAKISTDFRPVPYPTANLDFTSSNWWAAFSIVQEAGSESRFYIETARPITNEVILYELVDGIPVQIQQSGDGRRFMDKSVKHRKTLLALQIEDEARHNYLLKMVSDGEVLQFPLIFHTPQSLTSADYSAQLWLGIFYGALLFVFLIYSFFYYALKQNAFLYYVLYVASLFLLQFALDGYAFQYLFPDSPWLANHLLPASACLSVFFVMIYSSAYMRLSEILPKLNKVFKVVMGIALLSLIGSISSGFLFEITFPIINIFSFLGLLLTVFTIFYARYKKHPIDMFFATAFAIIIAGAVVFILGNLNLISQTPLTQNSLKIGTAGEVIFLSFSMAKRYRDMMIEKQAAQAESLKKAEELNKIKEEINARLEIEVAERTQEISEQKEELAEKNKDIMDSIRYAMRIQKAILPPDEMLKNYLPGSFVFYEPRDIVSGDFYWLDKIGEKSLFAAVDCTGHGIPGAFVSIVGYNVLHQAITEKNLAKPSDILDFLTLGVNKTLRQTLEDDSVRDGMDIALCSIDFKTKKFEYAGANNPLYILRNGSHEMEEVKADKKAIGSISTDGKFRYTNHEFQLAAGDKVYVFSDGFPDQFGGDRGKKYKYSRFREFLVEKRDLDSAEIVDALKTELVSWRGPLEQVDDVLVIGLTA